MDASTVDVSRHITAQWQEVVKRVNQSVVFIDSASAEALNWSGGAGLLYNAGAQAVKEFTPFESCPTDVRKAVFILHGYISEDVENTIRDVVLNSRLQYVIVISSMPSVFHTAVRHGRVEQEDEVFQRLEDSLLIWMKNANYSAEIVYVPLVGAVVARDFLILPGFHQVMSLLPCQWHALSDIEADDASHGSVQSLTQLPDNLHLQLKSLVYGLNNLMELLHVGEEVFCMGATSRLVATELANLTLAKTRRKNAQKKASLLIVDRTLDLPAVIGHHSDILLDKLLAGLPHLDGHHSDVKVDMATLWCPNMDVNPLSLPPGCLAHPNSSVAKALLGTFAKSRVKEGLMEVNRCIVEMMAVEGVHVEMYGKPGRVTAEQINRHLEKVSSEPAVVLRNSELLQLGLACVQAHKITSTGDRLLAAEKGLISAAGLDEGQGQNPVEQMLAVMSGQSSSVFSLRDILGLLVMAFSLVPHVPAPHIMEKIKIHLVQVMTETPLEALPQFVQDAVEGRDLPDVVNDIVDEIEVTLTSIPEVHQGLKQFNHAYSTSGVMGPSLVPLVKSLTQQMLEGKEELPDLEYKSTGLRNLLKSGFGLFMNVNKPRPTDHPLVILLVLGGVTSQEYKHVQEVVATTRSRTQVLFVGTKLITAEDAVEDIFSPGSYS